MRLSELRRSERERAAVPSKTEELGHAAAIAFLKGKDLSKYAVTMTELPKVGVNPRSKFNTPVGIYFYPADYYIDSIENGGGLPYQHGAKYINIIELTTDQILDLDNYTRRDLEKDVEILKKLKPKPGRLLSDENRNKINRWSELADQHANVTSWGGQLWYILWKTSELFANQSLRTNKPLTTGVLPPPRPSVIWNWLIRKLGYKVAIDSGSSIIHENEPNQGVIIDTVGTFQIVKRIQNISGSVLRDKKLLATLNSSQATEEDRIKAVQNNHHIFVKLNNPSEAVQIAAVEQHPWYFTRIKNPSINVQRTAVKIIPLNVVTYLKNKKIPIVPEIQKLAVETDPSAIRHIDNPSEELQLTAISLNPDIIESIPNATRKVKELAVTKDPDTIELIPNADFDLKMLAIKTNPYVIRFIKLTDPEEKMRLGMAAIEAEPDSIRFIANPPIELQLAAVTKSGDAIASIIDQGQVPNEAVQIAAVQQNPRSIYWLLTNQIVPSEAVQIAAIKGNPDVTLKDLKHFKIELSPRVLQAAGQLK